MATSTAAPSGRDFASTFDARYDPATGLRNGGVSDRLRDRLVREEQAKLHRQGWEPATVVNLQPFPLTLNLGELGTLEIPAATPETPVQTLTIGHYRISMRDLGDGNFTPVSVLPAELAKEIEREYGSTGGVFWYRGAGDPLPAQIAQARERQLAWYRTIYQQAIDSWARYRQHKMLTDRQRDAARALFTAGEIASLPEWVTITRAQADRRPCPMCGEDIKVQAKICRFCHTRLEDAESNAADDAAAETAATEAVARTHAGSARGGRRGANSASSEN